jgi:hypothetical protein
MKPATLLIVFAALDAALACGGSTTGNSGGANANDLSSFATQLCAAYAPCCADAGLPTNGQQCQALVVALGGAAGTYDPSAAATCLDAVRSAPNLCAGGSSNAAANKACNRVFANSSKNIAPGGPCTTSADCAPSADGTVDCYLSTTFNDAGGAAETGMCIVEKPGAAGDSPCIASVQEQGPVTITWWNISTGGMPPTEGFVCDQADGIYCDSQSSTCRPLGGAGGPCPSGSMQCDATTYCDFTSKTCAPRAQEGATCSGAVQCVVSAYCDTTSQTCTPLLPNGSVCTTNQECKSSTCVNGACSGGSTGLEVLCGK